MKRAMYLIILVGLVSTMLFAQKTKQGITVTTGQFSTSFFSQQQSDAVILPFIEGKHLTGSKEQYGVLFRSTQTKNALLEILNANGKVLQTVSLNDFLGKSSTTGIKLVSNSIMGNGRSTETVHEINLPDGSVKLITRGILAGEKRNANNPEQIVITFSLASTVKQNLSLRVSLPVEGNAEAKNNGIVLTGKSSASALSLSVMPSDDSISIKKNLVTVKSPTVAVSGETPMIWLSVRSTTAATQVLAKNLAADIIANSNKKNSGPSIVIVNMLSKENAQPGDTVTYTLVCKNIGAGTASDIILSNPIPAGTKYLDGSATAEGSELTIERNTVPPPQTSTVTLLKWKLKEILSGGKEQSVNFKVVIQ